MSEDEMMEIWLHMILYLIIIFFTQWINEYTGSYILFYPAKIIALTQVDIDSRIHSYIRNHHTQTTYIAILEKLDYESKSVGVQWCTSLTAPEWDTIQTMSTDRNLWAMIGLADQRLEYIYDCLRAAGDEECLNWIMEVDEEFMVREANRKERARLEETELLRLRTASRR
ncbi:hypothetical protein BBP40_007125 [Aspergillus hancockii]|nr:hypothetical protein BBP40_007125 [Aspergillus hancockii]